MTIRMSRSRWGTAAVIASVATIAVAFLAATPAQRSTVITPSSAGKVLRRDDIARVVRAAGANSRPAVLGDSDRVDVGDWVVAIGNPLGLHHSVTAGIISAKARGIDDSGLEFLQTDAAINPGNSGGPLFDLDGKVVGITTAIVSARGGNVGLNFAIPINTVKAVLPQLRTGRVVHGWLGVVSLPMNATGARRFGLRSPGDGLWVQAIASGGPADQAGLRPGDVLLGMVAGTPVNARDLHTKLRQLTPGTLVTLRVLRDGQRIELPVVIGTSPSSPAVKR
jgi:serine protease Do